jgi:glutaminase
MSTSMNGFNDAEGRENSRGGRLKTVINPGAIAKFGYLPVRHRQMTVQLMEDQLHTIRNTSR